MPVTTVEEQMYQRIYHRKWNSPENTAYHRQISTICGLNNQRIPLAWSREVYELLREIQQRFPRVQILNLKEADYRLKLIYRLSGTQANPENDTWIEVKIAQTVIILILKNAYCYTIDEFLRLIEKPEEEFQLYQKLYNQLSHSKILDYKKREPYYYDLLYLDDALPENELQTAQSYLDSRIPEWRHQLTHFSYQETANGHIQNPRLLIFIKLANKFSFFTENSVERAEEMLLLDKFSRERTRALFEGEVDTELSLKLYEQGARNTLQAIQSGVCDQKINLKKEELFFEREKSILLENIVAFYKSRQ